MEAIARRPDGSAHFSQCATNASSASGFARGEILAVPLQLSIEVLVRALAVAPGGLGLEAERVLKEHGARGRRWDVLGRRGERLHVRILERGRRLLGRLAALALEQTEQLRVGALLRGGHHAIEVDARGREQRRDAPRLRELLAALLEERLERDLALEVREELAPLDVLGRRVLERRGELHLRERLGRPPALDVEDRRDVPARVAREELVTHAAVGLEEALERREIARGEAARVHAEVAELLHVPHRGLVDALLVVARGGPERQEERRRPLQIRLAVRAALGLRALDLEALEDRLLRRRVRRVVRDHEQLAQAPEGTDARIRELVVEADVRAPQRLREALRGDQEIRERLPELVVELRGKAPVALERRRHEPRVVLEARAVRLRIEQALAAPPLRRVERRDPSPDRRAPLFALHADAIVSPGRATEARPSFFDRRERAHARLDAAASRVDERAERGRPEDAVLLLDGELRGLPRLMRGGRCGRGPRGVRRRSLLRLGLRSRSRRRRNRGRRFFLDRHRVVREAQDDARGPADERARSVAAHAPELRVRDVLRHLRERLAVVVRDEHRAAFSDDHEAPVGEHLDAREQARRGHLHLRERGALVGRADHGVFLAHRDNRARFRDARHHEAGAGFGSELPNLLALRDEDVTRIGRDEDAERARRHAANRLADALHLRERGAVGRAHEEAAVAAEPERAVRVAHDAEEARARVARPLAGRDLLPRAAAVARARRVAVLADDPDAAVGLHPRGAQAPVRRVADAELVAVVRREEQIASLSADRDRSLPMRREAEHERVVRAGFDRSLESELREGIAGGHEATG